MSSFRRNIMMFTRPIESQGVPAPIISPNATDIVGTQTISISITGIAINAEYSLDNSTWTTYTSPFTLPGSSTVYARALDADNNYSEVVSKSYTIIYDAQIEYLQSTGSEYINLPCSISKTDKFGVEFEIIPIYKNNNTYAIFSSNPYAQFNMTFYNYTSSTGKTVYVTRVGNNASNGGLSLDINIKNTVELTTQGKSVNGTYTALSRPLTAAITAFRLFGNYNNTNRYPTKICSFKIKKNDIAILDLIPVRIGQVGYMYDKISGNKYGNNNTSGAFVLGNDIN